MYTISDVIDSILDGQRKQAWEQMTDPTSGSDVELDKVLEAISKDEGIKLIRVGLQCGFLEVKHPRPPRRSW